MPKAGERNSRAIDAEISRNNILDVARSEFADKGLSGARIDEIAEKTNTSKRMIYYHFGSKEGLYQAVLEDAYGRIRQSEATLKIETMGAEEALSAIVGLTFDYHQQHPEFVRLVMNENIHRGAYIVHFPGIEERNRSVIQGLGAIIARGRAEGLFRDGIDPIDLHMTISALCFHNVSNRYTFMAIFRNDMTSPKAVAQRRAQVIEIVLASVRRPGTKAQ